MTLSNKFNFNLSRERKIDILVYLLLVFLFFALVFPTLKNETWEILDNWRQADTYSVALDYYRNGIDLLNPRFSYYGKYPQKIQLELMILPALGTLVSKLTEFSPTIFRTISATAFVISAIFLYKLSIERKNRRVALIASVIYILLPFSQFYGRTIMPESFALLGYVASFYFFSKWENTENFKDLLFSSVFLGFGLLEKLTLGFIGIVPAFMLLYKYKKRFLISKEVWIYGFISLVIPLIYYYIVGIGAKDPFVRQIYGIVIDTDRYNLLESLRYIMDSSFIGLTPIVSIIGLLSFFYFLYKKDLFVCLWYVGLLLSMISILSGIRLMYYLIFFMPLFSYATSVLIDEINIEPIKLTITVIVIAITFFNGQNFLISNAKADPYLDSIIGAIYEYIPEKSFIAINGENPAPISATGNFGYRLPMNEKDKPIKLMQAMDEGLEYYVFLKYNDLDRNFYKIIESNSDLVYQNLEVAIFKFHGK